MIDERNTQFVSSMRNQKAILKELNEKNAVLTLQQGKKTVCPLEQRNQLLQKEELQIQIDRANLES